MFRNIQSFGIIMHVQWLEKRLLVSHIFICTFVCSSFAVLKEHLGTEYNVVDLLQHVDGNNMTQLTLLEVPGSNPRSTAYQLKGTFTRLTIKYADLVCIAQLLN